MSHLSRPMGIPQSWNARQAAELDRRARSEPRDDLHVTRPATAALTPEIASAIKAREAKVLADVHEKNLRALKARHEAGADARCRAIQARIFQQIAVGGVRNGK